MFEPKNITEKFKEDIIEIDHGLDINFVRSDTFVYGDKIYLVESNKLYRYKNQDITTLILDRFKSLYKDNMGFCHWVKSNQKYWQHIPYLGLGPSAHSFHGKRRWWNIRSIKQYCAAVEKGRPPVEGFENLTDEQFRIESLALGLRTSAGIDLGAVNRTPQSDAVLSRLQASGFVKVIDGRIIPTREGFLVADQLPVCFFEGV